MGTRNVTTKFVDNKGRVTLGQEFASGLVIVKRLGKGLLEIIRAEAVPAREAWLYKNPEALAMVIQGLEDAKAGRLGRGPDLKAGDELAEAIED
jgi:hypothetical protein